MRGKIMTKPREERLGTSRRKQRKKKIRQGKRTRNYRLRQKLGERKDDEEHYDMGYDKENEEYYKEQRTRKN